MYYLFDKNLEFIKQTSISNTKTKYFEKSYVQILIGHQLIKNHFN